MDKIESQVTPVPPNVLTSLRSGFDAVANKIAVIIIPVVVDLFLWLGPHFEIKTLVNNFLNTLASSAGVSSIQPADIITSSLDIIRSAASQYNLLSLVRTIPVGIPSLMVSKLPMSVPGGVPIFVDVASLLSAVGIGIGAILLGLIAGSFYYILVSQAALDGKFELRKLFANYKWVFIQVFSLTLAILILFIVISIPSSCAISAIALFGLPLGQFAVFLYLGILLWLAFPLIFSAHGIFVNHINALASVQRSMALTRMTLPATSLFVLIVLGVSEGLDLLWRVPPVNSWLTLVGVGGHAFITTALLAASFVYYRDADHWVQEILRIAKSKAQMPLHGG